MQQTSRLCMTRTTMSTTCWTFKSMFPRTWTALRGSTLRPPRQRGQLLLYISLFQHQYCFVLSLPAKEVSSCSICLHPSLNSVLFLPSPSERSAFLLSVSFPAIPTVPFKDNVLFRAILGPQGRESTKEPSSICHAPAPHTD